MNKLTSLPLYFPIHSDWMSLYTCGRERRRKRDGAALAWKYSNMPKMSNDKSPDCRGHWALSRCSGICWFVDVEARCSRGHMGWLPVCYSCWADLCPNYFISNLFWAIDRTKYNAGRAGGLLIVYWSEINSEKQATESALRLESRSLYALA